jgi:drug/metabolite transporter (DMT)-like permease
MSPPSPTAAPSTAQGAGAAADCASCSPPAAVAPAGGAPHPHVRLAGVGYVLGAYFLYAVGDAAAKWLVGSLPVWEILFFRSWLGLLFCMLLGRRSALLALQRIGHSRGLIGMNLANFGGWAAYYSAAAFLPLPQLYTIYYLSPIMAALLAGPMLGERIHRSSWIAGGLGFLGVLITTSPADSPLPALVPACLGLGAALLWALSSILYRRNVHGSSNLELLIYSNIVIGSLSAVPLAWTWHGFGVHQAFILVIVTVAGLAAHYLYIGGVRRVPVAVAGPIGYFSLIWTALLAYLIWGDVPQSGLLLGGSLILVAGLLVLGAQWRRSHHEVDAD